MNYKALVSTAVLALAMPFAQAGSFDFSCTDCPIALDPNAPSDTTTLSSINVDLSGAIQDINVFISIEHTFSGDLDIFLINDTTGTMVELTTDNGGGNDDAYLDTTFDDDAAINIVDAAVPFTGTFAPEGLLADFNGEDLMGSWTLSITDDFTFDGGQVLDWGIFGEAEMAAVAEPGMLSLMGLGIVGFAIARRRKS
ncbi:MAG: proprotein convertase P-domain-containing protein [Gammaproteobacteria bacterium]